MHCAEGLRTSADYPTGESQVAFKGKWDFDWQLGYDLKERLCAKARRIPDHRSLRQFGDNKFKSDPPEDRVLGPQNWMKCPSPFPGIFDPGE